MEKKVNHQANVVRIAEVLPHPNADKLQIIMVGGYQCVVGKDSMKSGDLAVYIQPDSVVPQTKLFEFVWKDHVGIDGIVPERRRRITVRRFRKEWSEGLLLPLSEFPQLKTIPYSDVRADQTLEGDDVSDLIGVTHWVPECDRESTSADTANAPKRKPRRPHSLRGWFWYILYKLGYSRGIRCGALDVSFDAPVYDVDPLKHHANWIGPEDSVHVTEKIHGSNARYVVVDGVLYCGSRQQWKKDGDNVWWNVSRKYPAIQRWCSENPGKVLYGEVGPTQKGFRYGASEKEVWFFAFDVYDPELNEWYWPGNVGFAPCAPPVYVGLFKDIPAGIEEGSSLVPEARHIREGVVVSVRDRRCKLKIVSRTFLEKDNQ